MKHLVIAFLLVFEMSSFGQVAINLDGTAPDNSAMLDIKSSNRGVLFPRMTLSQIESIISPANGLIIYCIDCGQNGDGAFIGFCGDTWKTFMMCSPLPSPVPGPYNSSNSAIIWRWHSVTGALGYKWNTTNDYSTAIDMDLDTTYTEANLECDSNYVRYIWSYNYCGSSLSRSLTFYTKACGSFNCGDSLIVVHISGVVAPVNKSVIYGTVANIVGEESKCWITSNLGADHQAATLNDPTEQSAGWYWQFNHKQGYKHDGISRIPNTQWINYINEDSDWIIEYSGPN